jgi:predicted glycoside hydrolase/deacetylase ChbG (UPF0249 family)
MPIRIVVNADDLGIREDINEAIFDGMRRGVITSATMLANGPAVVSAARQLYLFPGCSFGVHLNLTQFEPLWQGSLTGLANILDQNNRFNGNAIREVKISAVMLRAIYQEWCCQIEKLMRLGVEPSHLDAHHHVHTIPQMLPVLASLRWRYKISKVRISRNMYTAPELPSRILLAKKWLYNAALRNVGFRTTRIFTDLQTFLKLCVERPPAGRSAELMTHPGSSPASEEARLLEGDWRRTLAYKATLINYNIL